MFRPRARALALLLSAATATAQAATLSAPALDGAGGGDGVRERPILGPEARATGPPVPEPSPDPSPVADNAAVPPTGPPALETGPSDAPFTEHDVTSTALQLDRPPGLTDSLFGWVDARALFSLTAGFHIEAPFWNNRIDRQLADAALSPVPVPGAALLLASAVAGLGLMRLRR